MSEKICINNFKLFDYLWDLPTKPYLPTLPPKKSDQPKRKQRSKPRARIYQTFYSSTEKAVAVYIANCRNSAHLRCYPGYAKISLKTGFRVNAVRKAIDVLERTKVIFRHKVYDAGELRYTQYFFYFDGEKQKEIYEDYDSILSNEPPDGMEEFLRAWENETNMPF